MEKMKQIEAAFNRVFVHNDDGRLILEKIKEHAGFNSSGYVPDSDRTVFNAGRRELAIWIENMSKEKTERQEEQNG